jgi:hypothetical protein
MPNFDNLDLIIIISISTGTGIGIVCLCLCLFVKCCSTIEHVQTSIVVQDNFYVNPMQKPNQNLGSEACNEDPV